MKKTFLFFLVATTTCFMHVLAQDVMVSDSLKNLPAASINPAKTLIGEYFDFTAFKMRRGANDNFTDGTLGAWFAKEGYIHSNEPIEGGIKKLYITWGRWGTAAGQHLKLLISIDGAEVGSIEHTEGNNIDDKAKQPIKEIELNLKKNFSLRVDNTSVGTNDCRFTFGPIAWTPYLFYTTKTAEVQKGQTYINTDLANNLEPDMAAPAFSSDNPAVATVNPATGEVTGVSEGTAIITAKTGEITTTYAIRVLPSKPIADAAFTDKTVTKRVSDKSFINPFTTNGDGTITYSSSNPACATVHPATGEVSIVGTGESTITSEAPETENFTSVSVSYTLYVKPDAWKIETFNGAATNVGGNTATYSTSVLQSTSSDTGINWEVFLGSIRNDIGNFGSNAVAIRAKKPTAAEENFDFAYLKSATIAGGIDSLTFEWNSNGSESGRRWDISILINDVEVGKIAEAGGAILPAGGPFNRFSVGNLKTTGDFTIKIINNSTASGDANQLRFVLDNLEWISYSKPIVVQVEDPQTNKFEIYPTYVHDVINISTDESDYSVKLYNLSGELLSENRNTPTIQIGHLPSGIYFADLSLKSERQTYKIIKK